MIYTLRHYALRKLLDFRFQRHPRYNWDHRPPIRRQPAGIQFPTCIGTCPISSKSPTTATNSS